MECTSGVALNTMQWVAVYREVVAAVEAQRIQLMHQCTVWESMQNDVGGQGRGNRVDVPEIQTMLNTKMWRARVQERHVLE